MIKFTIPYRLPSLNDYITAERSHRHAGAKMKREQTQTIAMLLRGQKLKPPEKPVHIRFTWYEQTERRDKDNVAFAKKFILDAMQVAGVIKNDNNRYVAGFTDFFVYGQGNKVVVEVIEV